jgi:hypothetical protein
MDGQRKVKIPANPDRGEIVAKEGFFVVAASNPDAPGSRASEALLSRFRIHIEVGTDYALARKLGVDTNIVTIASNADRKRKNGQMLWAPQLRELLAFRDNAELLGFDFAVANLMQTCPVDERSQFASIVERTLGNKHDALEAGKQVKVGALTAGGTDDEDDDDMEVSDDE